MEDQEGVRRGREGPEEVGKVVGESRRSGRTWGSNGTLQSPLEKDSIPLLVESGYAMRNWSYKIMNTMHTAVFSFQQHA